LELAEKGLIIVKFGEKLLDWALFDHKSEGEEVKKSHLDCHIFNVISFKRTLFRRKEL
jgi:hypothetical protein